MANLQFRDGFAGNCTLSSGGTGAYTGITAIAGYAAFSALTDGDVVECTVRTSTAFETGKYTKSGGGTPSLTRTRVFSQIDLSSNPVNWAAGTQVLIHSGMSGKDAASITGENEYETHQHIKTAHLTFGADKLSYLHAPANGQLRAVTNGVTHTDFLLNGGAGEPQIIITHTDSGALAGPGIVLDRNSSSQAANDLLGYIIFAGRDSGNAYAEYARIFGGVASPANGSESGTLLFQMARAGSQAGALQLTSNFVKVFPGFTDSATGVLVGKSAQGISAVGVELNANGVGAFCATSTPPIITNRLGGAGQIIACYVDGVYRGGLDWSSGKVGLNGAVLFHLSEWVDEPGDDDLHGAVLCGTEEELPDGTGRHFKCRLSDRAGDPAVWGTVSGRTRWDYEDGVGGFVERTGLRVEGTGLGSIRVVGPVALGDLLETSDLPGVARAQMTPATWWRRARPDQTQRAWTMAKAWQTVPPGEVRKIRCTLMAG